MEDNVDKRDPIEVLGEEFLERHRRGERPSIKEYEVLHPQLAEEIRGSFQMMQKMEMFKFGSPSSAAPSREWSHQRPDRIGDFRIIREIGRGGMGVVYEAEQESLGRRVAVKVFPKQTILNSRQLQRFHREARTAASLHHTNIVPVFGVGEQDGLHYYVMQYIQGLSLDDFINGIASQTEAGVPAVPSETSHASAQPDDRTKVELAFELIDRRGDAPPTKSRPRSIADVARLLKRKRKSYWKGVAEIGIQVADAIACAHEQSIVHRDIKPGNLIRDASGKVWITDFGLATVVEAERLSNPGDLVGTLRFMAPEALGGEYDPRSDIYGLGLTLYELMTFCPAFDEPHRHSLVQKIMKGELTRPRKFRPDLPRDLEAIVLKAAAHEPKRRYQSAPDLAQDLNCFLQRRPVRARPLGSAGRTARWMGRNPLVASLSAVLLLVALGAFAGITTKWRESAQQNLRAEENLSIALDSMDRMLERYASSWMSQPLSGSPEDAGDPSLGIQIAVSDFNAEVLQDSLQFYNRFAERNEANPKLQRHMARVHRRVGDIYERLGQSGRAEAAYRRALTILETRFRNSPTLVIDRADVMNQLALAMRSTGRFEEAASELRVAIQLLQTWQEPESPACRYELARTYSNLGQVLPFLPGNREARDSHRKAISLLEGLVEEWPLDVAYRLALAQAYGVYDRFSPQKTGRDSTQIGEAAVAMLEKLVEDYPGVPDYECELSQMLLTTSRSWQNNEPPTYRAQQLRRSIDLARQLTVRYPSMPRYRALLAQGLKEQGKRWADSRRESADRMFEESVEIYRSLANDFSGTPVYKTFLAMSLEDRADNLLALERPTEAAALLTEAIQSQVAYLRLRSESRFAEGVLRRQYEKVGPILRSLGLGDEADRLENEAAATLSVNNPPHSHSPRLMKGRASRSRDNGPKLR